MNGALTTGLTAAQAARIAAQVPDPELPFVTIGDLGILRDVRLDGATAVVTVTPTYSGCPAMREIVADLGRRLRTAGAARVDVRVALHPAWTTDWITPVGHRKLQEAGIAPPGPAPRRAGPVPIALRPSRPRVACPRCGSTDTTEVSAFSGTACTAALRCRACAEPFDRFKEL